MTTSAEKDGVCSDGKRHDLTKCSIWRTLLMLSAPMVMGMGLQTAFNITDTFFVGIIGSDALAALSVTFPVVFIFIAIASGLSVGSTALMAQAIGAGRMKDAGNIAEHSLLSGAVIGVVVAMLGLAFSPPLFAFMGVSGHVLEMTVLYSRIIFVGFIFLFVGFLSQAIIHAGGDTMTPAKNLAVAVVANIIIDPVMIFGFGPVPAMGIAGAAYATVLTMSMSAFLNILHILRGKAAVKIDLRYFRFNPGILSRIFRMGSPSSLSLSINSVGMILLMGLVGTFGTAAIAAFGVGLRLESLAILPVIGVSNALIPFIGQNLGAGKPGRARRALNLAAFVVIGFMSAFSLLIFFAPGILFAPFSSDPAVIATGEGYFRVIAFGYVFFGLTFVFGAAMQAAGRTGLQMFVNLFRWSITIILAYVLSSGMGIEGIWWGFPIGNIAGAALAFGVVRGGRWLKGWEEKDGTGEKGGKARHGHS